MSVRSSLDVVPSNLDGPQLVRITRDKVDPVDESIEGYIIDASEAFLLIHKLSDRIDLDGYQAIRRSEITMIERDFPRKPFLEEALTKKGIFPKKPSEIQLSDIKSLVESTSKSYPLLVIHRELVASDQCEIGQIIMLTDERYSLKEITPDAEWSDRVDIYKLDDITCLTFDGEYENTLALVAGIM